jgi:hypothetical protein
MTFGSTRIGLRDRKLSKTRVLLLGLTALALSATVPAANAVVCARGVYRAGCVGPNGGVVVRRPYGGYYNAYRRPYVRGVRVYR